jgi:RNA polymerase sigma-70 factor (ECF subfamily)
LREESREAVFNRIVEENKRLLLFAARNHASGENIRDLHQEILLRLWQSVEVFKGQASYTTWAYRVALNTALDFRDRQKRSTNVSFKELPESILKNLQAPQPQQMDGPHLLQLFIESLPEPDGEIFRMYLNDFSYREISEVTGLGENCLRMRISRLKRRLEERLVGS